MEYEKSKINVEKVYRKDGEFTTDNGNLIKYSNYYIDFTIGEYNLIFSAKIDKTLAKYIEKAYAEN